MKLRGRTAWPGPAWQRKVLSTCAATAIGVAAFGVSLPAFAHGLQDNQVQAPRTVDFNIRSQRLQDALLAYSEQAGVQIILPGDMASDQQRRSLRGAHDVVDALTRLVEGTGYSFSFTGENTVVVRRQLHLGQPVVPVPARAEEPPEREEAKSLSQRLEAEEPYLEELVTVGTRNRTRTVTETAVPVDVIGSGALHRNGYTQTGRLLQALAPSFNFTETTISDGTDIVRPATLRGLGPDQVLVLVNGKRRHSQSWVNVQNTVGKGAVGTDMNTIPVGAIKRVEILRDGAAAQYGSDAIAGVVNIVLKDYDEGFSGSASWGQTYEGDGDTFFASSTVGLPLATGGFFNVTAEYQNRQATNRADPSSITGDVVMRIGETDVEAMALMWNMALPGKGGGELYAFGGYMNRKGLSGGFYRHAHQAARSVPQLYPEGFLPLQRTDVTDFSQAVGFRFDAEDGWQYDMSATYGRTRFAFGAENTVNVSVASAAFYNGLDPLDYSITEGFSGALEFEQLTANFDAVGSSQIGTVPFNLAYGFEYRNELYGIRPGDEASYSCGTVNGDFAPSILDPEVTAVCGFQGFPGYSPDVSGELGRSSYAFYVDTEFEPGENWFFTAAARYENFGRTGSKITGKLSARYQASETLALRGAVSTGFRAPALAQRAFTSVITNTSAEGLTQTLVAPEGHIIPRTYGVDKLEHESNTNVSVGLVWKPGSSLSVTLDAYRIDIRDRIVLGPTLPIPDGLSLGPVEAGSFFSNGIDTRTHGADLVATYEMALKGEASLDLIGSISWNQTMIQDINAPEGVADDDFFPFAERVNVERGQPRFRAATTVDYRKERFGALLRVNYYGNTESAFYTAVGNNIPRDVAVDVLGLDYSPTTKAGTAAIVDLEFSYDVGRNLTFAVGANNLFNTYPDKLANNDMSRWISEGRQIGAFGNFRYPWVTMPWGIRGGYYYARMAFEF